MHLLGICALLVFLLFTNLASDSSRSDDYYYDYYYEQERTDEPVRVSTRVRGNVCAAAFGKSRNHRSSIHPQKSNMGQNKALRSGGDSEDLWRRLHRLKVLHKFAGFHSLGASLSAQTGPRNALVNSPQTPLTWVRLCLRLNAFNNPDPVASSHILVLGATGFTWVQV